MRSFVEDLSWYVQIVNMYGEVGDLLLVPYVNGIAASIPYVGHPMFWWVYQRDFVFLVKPVHLCCRPSESLRATGILAFTKVTAAMAFGSRHWSARLAEDRLHILTLTPLQKMSFHSSRLGFPPAWIVNPPIKEDYLFESWTLAPLLQILAIWKSTSIRQQNLPQ